ncbi:MAG TPA: adenosylmethionine decarboxylase [bacterium]
MSKDKLETNIHAAGQTPGHTHEMVKHQLTPSNGKYPVPYIEHWVLQVQGVAPEKLNDPERLLATLNTAVDRMELTRVSDHSHYFGPGVSTVIILAESHLSAHTWPELGYAHLDVVTCVKKLTRESLETAMREAFQPEHIQLVQLEY